MLQEALSHSQAGCFQLSNESISIVEWGEMMPKYLIMQKTNLELVIYQATCMYYVTLAKKN